MSSQIFYSHKYCDNDFEYRHVVLPRTYMSIRRLLSEEEWRSLGVKQSRGWTHYMIHKPEPHILLFRRPITREEEDHQQSNGTTNHRTIAI